MGVGVDSSTLRNGSTSVSSDENTNFLPLLSHNHNSLGSSFGTLSGNSDSYGDDVAGVGLDGWSVCTSMYTFPVQLCAIWPRLNNINMTKQASKRPETTTTMTPMTTRSLLFSFGICLSPFKAVSFLTYSKKKTYFNHIYPLLSRPRHSSRDFSLELIRRFVQKFLQRIVLSFLSVFFWDLLKSSSPIL